MQPLSRFLFFCLPTFLAKNEIIDGADADRYIVLVIFDGLERGDLYLKVAMAGLIGNDFQAVVQDLLRGKRGKKLLPVKNERKSGAEAWMMYSS